LSKSLDKLVFVLYNGAQSIATRQRSNKHNKQLKRLTAERLSSNNPGLKLLHNGT